MSLEDVENIKKRIENFKKTLIELTESPNINGTTEQHKIREMSAEVVDSNPYRWAFFDGFFENYALHSDHCLNTISTTASIFYKRFWYCLVNHHNALTRELAANNIPKNPHRHAYSLETTNHNFLPCWIFFGLFMSIAFSYLLLFPSSHTLTVKK